MCTIFTALELDKIDPVLHKPKSRAQAYIVLNRYGMIWYVIVGVHLSGFNHAFAGL